MLFPLSRPAWASQFGRDPFGLLTALVLPMALVAAVTALKRPDQIPVLLAIGWTLLGVLPAAVRGRTADPNLELRWRAQPFGAADRWNGAMATFVPMAIVWALLVAAAAFFAKPMGTSAAVGFFGVAALCAASTAAWGVAFGALSRRPWHRAGLLGLGLGLSWWAMMPGAPGWLAASIPSGQVVDALAALPRGLAAASSPLIQMAIAGLFGVIVGVLGYGRR